jgi:hypothetical protein
LVDRLFGPKLISFRSFGASLLVSSIAFFLVLFFYFPPFTEAGTNGIKHLFSFNSLYSSFGMFVLAVIVSLCVDYVSVIETRWLLRMVPPGTSARRLIAFLSLDLVLTFLLFIFLNPLTASVVTEVPTMEHLARSGGKFEIDVGDPMVALPEGINPEEFSDLLVYGQLMFSHYATNLNVQFQYATIQLSRIPPFFIEFPYLYYYMQDDGSVVQRPYFMYPFTVFFITTFATSIWIILYTVVTLVGQFLMRYALWTRALIERLNPSAGGFAVLTAVFTFQWFIVTFVIWNVMYFFPVM